MKLLYFFDEHIKPRISKGLRYCNPENTGILSERISCVRQNDVNMWFYRKNATVIAFDSGHLNFPGQDEEFAKIDIDPIHSGYRTDIDNLFAFRHVSATFSRAKPFDEEGPWDFRK